MDQALPCLCDSSSIHQAIDLATGPIFILFAQALVWVAITILS